jgi:hypothetical protein
MIQLCRASATVPEALGRAWRPAAPSPYHSARRFLEFYYARQEPFSISLDAIYRVSLLYASCLQVLFGASTFHTPANVAETHGCGSNALTDHLAFGVNGRVWHDHLNRTIFLASVVVKSLLLWSKRPIIITNSSIEIDKRPIRTETVERSHEGKHLFRTVYNQTKS